MAKLKLKKDSEPEVVTYFIDEAGTPTLFGHRHKILVGTDETSRYFLLGKLEVGRPALLTRALAGLRKSLLADPYFSSVPSMDPERRKTAEKFHAKDDIPEVRDRVFHLLMEHDVHFSAVVRDKQCLLEEVQARNQAEPSYKYNENELYDDLVSQLFKTAFHKADHFEVVFASRGAKDRSKALEQALGKAQQIYEQNFGVKSKHTVTVTNSSPVNFPCLQAVDYFLWALQRFYEKDEDRFWTYVWPKVRSIHDIDDRREDSFGRIYTAQKPLTKEARAKK